MGEDHKYHFVRSYRRISGRTPMEEVRIMRIEYAKHLIMTTDLPLKSIATRAGLANQYHLCRLFRKYLNTTPGTVRTGMKDPFSTKTGAETVI